MASIRLQPPEPFQFKRPDDWPKWKRRFEQFRAASGLAKEGEEQQVSTLLYCLGEDAEDVLISMNIAAEDRKSYEAVISHFDDYFKVRINVILERAKFNRRAQKEGETAEEYITALYNLVETCNYKGLKEEMIRDRLVVGIRDTGLSEKLQMDPKLTLDEAKRKIRQREAVIEQRKELHQDGRVGSQATLEEVKTNRSQIRGGTGGRREGRNAHSCHKDKPQCKRCGNDTHPPDKCPAKGATCHKCGKKGHFSKKCFTKTGASTRELSLDSAFLGTLGASDPQAWTVNVGIANKEVPFKIDTGAEVTAISEDTYHTLRDIPLEKPSKVIYGPSRQRLQVVGQIELEITLQDKRSTQHVFVIRNMKVNLLGLPAIVALGVLKRVDEIEVLEQDVRKQFPKLFQGLGNLGEEYHIPLKEGAAPYALTTPRNVPLPLRSKVQDELNSMEAMGVISKIDQPTEWCAGMVVVPKKSGDVRICVDLKALNDNVIREIHPMPKVDETLSHLAGATIFTKLDANSGFWQIPLARKSRPLTTFVTPFGRYCFNKLPFGITSAPEIFQKRMNRILEGLKGVICHMDDVLVFGATMEEHDANLLAVLKRLEEAGATLNSRKCKFRQPRVNFLGHLLDKEGIRADPSKVQAVLQMETPQSVTDLRRFMGMTNHLGKFSPRIAELSQPMRELLCTKNAWVWGPEQERSFSNVKEELTRPTVLALYDPDAETKVSADASSFGLGAVLLQKSGQEWRPVAYASRSSTETERRYAQIEKEALAVTWACEKYRDYVLGRHIEIETDHKPLVPLLSNKRLDGLPPRVLRFRLRLDRYDYQIRHVPGKELYVADTLSRAPLTGTEANSLELQDEAETFIAEVVKQAHSSMEQHPLETYRLKQAEDPICAQVSKHCKSGWPRKHRLSPELIPYWKLRGSLTTHDDILLFNDRIVIPESLRADVMDRVHEGHQGIERCRMRVCSSVWWPGCGKEVTETVQKCPTCAKTAKQRREPLIVSQLPEYPWKVIGTDLFELDKKHYLLVVDYFSRYPEVVQLGSTTSNSVIQAMKSIFSRHGIPETVRSDNGPQYSSSEFSKFASSYGFSHVTSSPLYPQSNGQAERTVQTVKRLLKQSGDPYLALMSYRATPLTWCGFSPTELLMGRQIRTTVPQTSTQFIPKWAYLGEFRRLSKLYKEKQKSNYDREHRVKELPELPEDTQVWVTSETGHTPGRIAASTDTPRSYIVETPSGELRRNRSHLRVDPGSNEGAPTVTQTQPEASPRRIMTRSRTGTAMKAPERLGLEKGDVV